MDLQLTKQVLLQLSIGAHALDYQPDCILHGISLATFDSLKCTSPWQYQLLIITLI